MKTYKMKHIKTFFTGLGYKHVLVQVDSDVYRAFIDSDFSGFTTATRNENIVEVEVGTGRDDSKWQHVLHDEILSVI